MQGKARHAGRSMPPKVEYSLSERGRKLEPVILALKVWGEANVDGIGDATD